jgi:hypothetical protein
VFLSREEPTAVQLVGGSAMFVGSSNPGFCTRFTGAGVGVCALAGTRISIALKIRITASIIRPSFLMRHLPKIAII